MTSVFKTQACTGYLYQTKPKTMNILLKLIVITVINVLSFQLESQETHAITVSVEGVSSNKGQMFIALYNAETRFLESSYKGTASAIENNKCVVTFNDIPKGVYAVSIFHDENSNGKLDTNFLGIPKEDYGCSNNAKGFMGPPEWSDAKFELKANKTINISL
ncbi:Uncharacterized conserved protein, DUF2141 family [Winogradskyella sediminis]|uniref:Uncharacterized conserved protein, DUF2141 family n=2 Tax=Winogradskyella sediminis TaxID=1382466 RepID=A0A1H1NFK8_9FLAO|nr:uncharacterized protein (DUF2141 family) [Winogradskyella sediminis]SDR97754.1 Uncharacterized conserved protein, DUF2141 family [Winogradskyella sediminis]